MQSTNFTLMHVLSLSNLELTMLIISVLLTGVSAVLSYMSRWVAVLLSFAALFFGKLSGLDLDISSMIFWGVAALIVVAIYFLLPRQVSRSRVGLPFFCTGALVGALVGLLLNTMAGVIIASAVGVLMGAVAFSRMKAGRVLGFPSKKFFNYLCAKGLPLVVIFSMLGILCLHFISLGARV